MSVQERAGTETTVTVSVVIPAYRAAAHVGETLDSVFAQTFTDYEVILINDGSPDSVPLERVLEGYGDKVIYVTQPNGGPSRARNTGIRKARGRYVALLDSDDIWMPGYLGEQVRSLQADPTLDVIYSNGVIFGDSPLAGRTLMDASPSRGTVTFEALVREECTVLLSCTVARRSTLLDAGLFDERFLRSEDYHLWLRLAFAGRRFAYHSRVLVRHRRSPGSLSRNQLAMMRAMIDVLRDIDRQLPLTDAQRAVVRRQIARRHALFEFEQGKRHFLAEQYDAAAEALRAARDADPDMWSRAHTRAIHLGVVAMPRIMRRLYGIWQAGVAAATSPLL
jgi:glycosyltransferase involved in cell wall biosynthesis